MFTVYTSNRLELLANELAHILRTPLANPLQKETIVVQSQGMQRWLSLHLAEQLGVLANCEFPFPNSIIKRIFKEQFKWNELKDLNDYEREVMLWALMEILPSYLENTEFSELRNYLENQFYTDESHLNAHQQQLRENTKQLKKFQLCLRIADLFDQYTLYRPDLIHKWENDQLFYQQDKNEHWQKQLWLALNQHFQHNHHRASLLFKLSELEKIEGSSRLPRRMAIFGIPNLPPAYLDIFAKLGENPDYEVNLFIFNPCEEEWSLIKSKREQARLLKHTKKQFVEPEQNYYEEGNILLASLGKTGRDLLNQLLYKDYLNHIYDAYETPQGNSLLTTLQKDILTLQNTHHWLEEHDNSIQIHLCHSPMREIEVLHEQLLALFEADPNLSPKDVVVMIPEIETYAPYIEAIFETVEDKKHYIPFSIADRSLKTESSLIESFIDLLELTKGRFIITEIVAVLSASAVRQQFNLEESELEIIYYWLQQLKIRWGMDGEHRAQWELPEEEEHTWRAGFQRLLLGYALPIKEDNLFADIYPFDLVEGQLTTVIGKLAAFVEKLFNLVDELKQPHSLQAWQGILNDILNTFFKVSEEQEIEAQHIRQLIENLVASAAQAAFDLDAKLSIVVIIAYLNNYLEGNSTPFNFITGQVTFCALLPLRSIPFKVVCLVGMNDQAFPRSQNALNFDLITQHPRVGDRSVRDNDRYLFLEALLSARQTFYLSYTGYAIHDNSEIPPSVVVSELIDYLRQYADLASVEELELREDEKKKRLFAHLMTHHPLQPFSPRYFLGNDKLFSFSKEYCEATRQLLNPATLLVETQQNKAYPFIEKPLEFPLEAEWQLIEVESLIKFFMNPIEFLLKNRLGIYLESPVDNLEENEPFNLDNLVAFQLKQVLLERAIADKPLDNFFKIAKAQGLLPHGKVGEVLYQMTLEEILPFIADVKALIATQNKLAPQTLHFAIPNSPFYLTGTLNHLYTDYALYYQSSTLRAKHYLRYWIYHLFLNSVQSNEKLPRISHLMGLEKQDKLTQTRQYIFTDVPQSLEILQQLVNLYWQGLQSPLSFFAESSLQFVQQLIEDAKKNTNKADSKAKETWEGGYNSHNTGRAERNNLYYDLYFGQNAKLNLSEEFKATSQQIYQQLLNHREML